MASFLNVVLCGEVYWRYYANQLALAGPVS